MGDRYIVVKVTDYDGSAPPAVARALADAGIGADVSNARILNNDDTDYLLGRFRTCYEVRPPQPTTGFTITHVGPTARSGRM